MLVALANLVTENPAATIWERSECKMHALQDAGFCMARAGHRRFITFLLTLWQILVGFRLWVGVFLDVVAFVAVTVAFAIVDLRGSFSLGDEKGSRDMRT